MMIDIMILKSLIFSDSKHAELLPHVDKIILGMLANRSPPSCIQANNYAMAKVIFHGDDIVKELPSVNHFKQLQKSIYIIAKTLSAFQRGSELKQLHSDETRWWQVSLLNLLIGLIPKTKKLHAICLDLGLAAKDGTTAEQARAIIQCFAECRKLLEQLKVICCRLFQNQRPLMRHNFLVV